MVCERRPALGRITQLRVTIAIEFERTTCSSERASIMFNQPTSLRLDGHLSLRARNVLIMRKRIRLDDRADYARQVSGVKNS